MGPFARSSSGCQFLYSFIDALHPRFHPRLVLHWPLGSCPDNPSRARRTLQRLGRATATDDIGSLAAHALQLETDTVLSRMRSVRSENHQGGNLTRIRDFFRERLVVLRDER